MLKLVINNKSCIEEFVLHKCAAQWHFSSTQIKKYQQDLESSSHPFLASPPSHPHCSDFYHSDLLCLFLNLT